MANVDHIDTDQEGTAEELEDALFENLEQDSRLRNGVSSSSQGSDLDFINMTGLTPPGSGNVDSENDTYANGDGLNPEAPISFYEKGVGDVDAQMDPDHSGHIFLEDEELVPSRPQPIGDESKTVAGLKEIIADLSSDIPENDTEIHATDILESSDEESELIQDDSSADLDALTELNLEAASTALEDLGNSVQGIQASADEILEPENAAAPFDFQEAGKLIRKLDDSESDIDDEVDLDDIVDLNGTEEDSSPQEPGSLITTVGMAQSERDSSVYNRPQKQGNSLRTRKRRGMTGRVASWSIRLVFLIAIAGAGYYVFQLYMNRTLSPTEVFANANKLVEGQEFVAASNAYNDFVRRFPNDVLRSDAEFMAGYTLYLVPATSPDSSIAYENSIALFEQFLLDNPTHHKAARAETLLGMVYFRTGSYSEAISRLGDPNRRLRDPGSYLSTLRTLARSYAAEGQIEKAGSAFLQAAALDSNVESDKDYLELANLYLTLSERTDNPAMSRRYSTLAIEQWGHAIRVPGMLSNQRKEIEAARDVLQSRLTLEQDMIAGTELDTHNARSALSNEQQD